MLLVAKSFERRYIGFEIDPEVAEMARQRVVNTQPPLFVPTEEQLPMDLQEMHHDTDQ